MVQTIKLALKYARGDRTTVIYTANRHKLKQTGINIVCQHIMARHITSILFSQIIIHVLQLIFIMDKHVHNWRNIGGPSGKSWRGYVCILCSINPVCQCITYRKSQMNFTFIFFYVIIRICLHIINSQRNTTISRLIMCRATGNFTIRKCAALRYFFYILE